MKKVLVLTALAAFGLVTSASANGLCPPIGSATSCSALITIDSNGSASIATDNTVGPYDGIEDSIIGIINNSSSTVFSVGITGTGIFGFDNDGMCIATYAADVTGTNSCTGAVTGDPAGYGGDFVTFNIVDSNTGTVNFVGGLAAGASQYWSLEENIADASHTVTFTPEPGSIALMLGGFGGLMFARKRFSK